MIIHITNSILYSHSPTDVLYGPGRAQKSRPVAISTWNSLIWVFGPQDKFRSSNNRWLPIYNLSQSSSLYRILRLGGGPGSNCPVLGGGYFFIGEIKNFAFLQTRKFSKNAKKSMKIL